MKKEHKDKEKEGVLDQKNWHVRQGEKQVTDKQKKDKQKKRNKESTNRKKERKKLICKARWETSTSSHFASLLYLRSRKYISVIFDKSSFQ